MFAQTYNVVKSRLPALKGVVWECVQYWKLFIVFRHSLKEHYQLFQVLKNTNSLSNIVFLRNCFIFFFPIFAWGNDCVGKTLATFFRPAILWGRIVCSKQCQSSRSVWTTLPVMIQQQAVLWGAGRRTWGSLWVPSSVKCSVMVHPCVYSGWEQMLSRLYLETALTVKMKEKTRNTSLNF